MSDLASLPDDRLDALLAEHLFGLTGVDRLMPTYGIGDVGEILLAMLAQGYRVLTIADANNSSAATRRISRLFGYRVSFAKHGERGGQYDAQADTLPRALVLACLRALGVTEVA